MELAGNFRVQPQPGNDEQRQTMSLMQRGGGNLHSRLQEDARPTRPSMQTAWDKGEHGNLNPAATEGGVRPRWRTTTYTLRAHDAACDKGGNRAALSSRAQHEGRGKCSPACVVKCNKYTNTTVKQLDVKRTRCGGTKRRGAPLFFTSS